MAAPRSYKESPFCEELEGGNPNLKSVTESGDSEYALTFEHLQLRGTSFIYLLWLRIVTCWFCLFGSGCGSDLTASASQGITVAFPVGP